MLEFMACVCWGEYYTVFTKRRGEAFVRRSDVSISLCRRLAPQLAKRHGIADTAGMFCGAILTPESR